MAKRKSPDIAADSADISDSDEKGKGSESQNLNDPQVREALEEILGDEDSQSSSGRDGTPSRLRGRLMPGDGKVRSLGDTPRIFQVVRGNQPVPSLTTIRIRKPRRKP